VRVALAHRLEAGLEKMQLEWRPVMAAMRNRRAFDHVEAFITEGGLYSTRDRARDQDVYGSYYRTVK
jgi:hypothetical protein